MAAQLESVLASLGRVESETVKSSQLKTTVADAMSEFTVRLEQTEKNIVALQATMKDIQTSLANLSRDNVSGSGSGDSNTWPQVKRSRIEYGGNASTRASSLPSNDGRQTGGDSDPKRVWFMGFPRPLLAGTMKQYMRKCVKDVCGEGVALATEFYAGNTKKHCSMVMPAKLDVNKFMELKDGIEQWEDQKDKSTHKINMRHDRSKADRNLGQHTGKLWKSVKTAMDKNSTWKLNFRMGTTGKGGTLWVSDGCDIHVIYNYATSEDGSFTATPAYEMLVKCCGIEKDEADTQARDASMAGQQS
jgi:hypothetical protein